MDWQRARNDYQIEARKNEIYKASLTLFKEKGYENVSLNEIAKKANFTKSNIYRYFKSKEDIFLSIFADMFETWQKNYIKDLKNLNVNESYEVFANTSVESYLKDPNFLDLIPLLVLLLERNSSYEQLIEFKRLSKKLLFELTLEMNRIYPSLEPNKAFRLIDSSFANTSSFWAANFENEVLNKLYKNEEFKLLKPNFKENLVFSIVTFLNGLLTNNTKL